MLISPGPLAVLSVCALKKKKKHGLNTQHLYLVFGK